MVIILNIQNTMGKRAHWPQVGCDGSSLGPLLSEEASRACTALCIEFLSEEHAGNASLRITINGVKGCENSLPVPGGRVSVALQTSEAELRNHGSECLLPSSETWLNGAPMGRWDFGPEASEISPVLKGPCYLHHLRVCPESSWLVRFSKTVWLVTMFLGVCEDGGLAVFLGSKFS